MLLFCREPRFLSLYGKAGLSIPSYYSSLPTKTSSSPHLRDVELGQNNLN